MDYENENQVGELYVVGTRGYSAYEVAVQNGFEGTVDEWLESLVGSVGAEGPQGEPGPQGIPGTPPQIRIGRVDTLAPEQNAYVNITGTPSVVVLSFGIPRGRDGESGTGGTSDYSALENKPSINNITLNGNLSLDDLNIQAKGNYVTPSDIPTKLSELTNDVDYTTKSYVDSLVGDINSTLDSINNEVI